MRECWKVVCECFKALRVVRAASAGTRGVAATARSVNRPGKPSPQRGTRQPDKCIHMSKVGILVRGLSCGVKTVQFVGNRWQRSILQRRFLAHAVNISGRASFLSLHPSPSEPLWGTPFGTTPLRLVSFAAGRNYGASSFFCPLCR